MIHIFSLHFKDDRWSKLQLDSIHKHVKVPYKTYSVYSHMETDTYKKWEDKWDIFLVKEQGKHEHKSGKFHLTDGHRAIIPEILKNANSDDIFLRLDSDAILIDNIDESFIEKVNKHKFIAIKEPQHEWDTTYHTPHPSLWTFPIAFLNTELSHRMSELLEDGHSNWWGGVVRWLYENSIEWYPLERSNKINLHPLYFGIYGDLVYHHWAGSRDMITRPDRKLAEQLGKSIEQVRDENAELNDKIMEQLNIQSDIFIKYLKGEEVDFD